MRRRLIAIFAWCLPALPVAHADEDAAKPWAVGVAESAQERALGYYRAGNEEYARGSCAKALVEYRRALKDWQHPAIHYNIAMCLVDLNDAPLAIYRHLTGALAFGAEPIGDDKYREGTRYLNLVRSQLAELTVVCDEPGTKVTLDRQLVLTGPGETKQLLLSGPHQLVAERAGRETTTRSVTLKAGGQTAITIKTRIPIERRFTTRWKRWKPWSVVGAGAVFLAASVPLAVVASNNASEYDRAVRAECPRDTGCQSSELTSGTRDLRSKARLRSGLSIAGFAVGGTLVVTGVVLLVLNRPELEAVNSTAIVPTVSSDQFGVSFQGAF